jgi:hypothetical protein
VVYLFGDPLAAVASHYRRDHALHQVRWLTILGGGGTQHEMHTRQCSRDTKGCTYTRVRQLHRQAHTAHVPKQCTTGSLEP